MKKLDITTAALLIVGGVNWGLVAIGEFDLVATLVGLEFGETNAVSRIVYGLVGVSAVYQIAQQRSAWGRSAHDHRVARGYHKGGEHRMRKRLAPTLRLTARGLWVPAAVLPATWASPRLQAEHRRDRAAGDPLASRRSFRSCSVRAWPTTLRRTAS